MVLTTFKKWHQMFMRDPFQQAEYLGIGQVNSNKEDRDPLFVTVLVEVLPLGRYWGASVSDSGFSVESKLATGSNPDF